MRRITQGGCGFQGYRCVQIDYMSDSFSLCCDQTLYDQVSDSRPNDNNFFNLPVYFQGVINVTKFIDLSSIQGDPTGCFDGYNPFQDGGLHDWWAKVSKVTAYSKEWGRASAYGQIRCYAADSLHTPGIIIPRPQLSSFASTPTIAVPTQALAAADLDASSLGGNYQAVSGCTGFVITARGIGSRSIRITVTSGDVLLGVDNQGVPQLTHVPESGAYALQQDIDLPSNTANIQIYIVAQYNVISNTWRAWVVYTLQPQLQLPAFTKAALLGTVRYAQRSVNVIQSNCSPLDMRDWVSQIGIPGNGSTAMYVFASMGESALKKWVKVQDCT